MNNAACVLKPLGALIQCFFRRICFPKLNFSELRTPYHTFTRLFSENGKRKGGRACQDLCQLNPISLGICFSSGVRLDVQIKQCLRLWGNVHGILSEANPKAAHSKGLICPSSLLTWNVSWGKSRASDFFPVGGHKSIINGMTSPRHSKMKATVAAPGTAFATTQSQCSGKMISAHFSLVQLPNIGSGGPRGRTKECPGRCWGKTKGKNECRIRYFWVFGVLLWL